MKTLKIVLNIFYAIICVYRCTAQEYSTSVDSLCYLTDGGSSQTFIVNEASPVNTVLGNLQVIGRTENNKSKPPEIELKIERVELSGTGSYALNENQQLETPIYIDNKQLILSRQLDREAPEGENGITVHIKCTRLIHTDSNNQPIYIPIRIIITDANDHSPVFLNAPYTANVSESAPIFSQLLPAGIIRAVDGDQEGPFSTVQYNVLPGPFSHMVRFESPLGGALLLASPLDFENQPHFWVEIAALDQGEPPRQAVTKVNINVIDADDQNPRFLDEKYTSIWNENLRIGDQLEIHPRPIKAIDPDLDINAAIEYQFNTLATMNEQDIVTLDPVHGTLKIARNLPVNAQFPRTYVLKAVQVNNPDRYALTTLTIFKKKNQDLSKIQNNSDKLHFVNSNYSASVLENSPAGQVILNIQVQPGPYSHLKQISFQLLDNEESHFEVKELGQIILKKPLDFEHKPFHLLRVLASDGTQSDICRINITVLDVNDHNPSFAQPYYNFFVPENKLHSNSIIGQIKVTDEDSMDQVKLSLIGPFSNWFSINDQGLLKIRTLNGINNTQCHLIVQASDTGQPPRTSSVPVTVQLPPSFINVFSNNIPGSSYDLGSDKQELNELNLQESNHFLDVNNLITGNASSSALILVIVLGVLLATLLIIIITLSVHLLKQKKYSSDNVYTGSTGSACSQSSSTHSPDGQLNFQHQLFTGGSSSPGFDTQLLPQTTNTIRINSSTPNRLSTLLPNGLDNPMFQPKTSFKTLELDSAIVSDVSSSEGGNFLINKINNPPPPPSSMAIANNNLIWSQQNGSIPRRVKKLTWEDEKFGGYGSTSLVCSGADRLMNYNKRSNGFELDPDVSVAPLQKTMVHQHGDQSSVPDCTVYF